LINDRAQLRNDPEEALSIAFDGRLANLWTSLPGLVTGVDLAANTCTVQPTIQGQVEDGNGNRQFVSLPLLLDVPIIWPKAGGFVLTLPLAIGDEVLVVIASRCIDAWWQSGGVQKPMEARMHDLSDGFAFPGPSSQPNKILGVSATGAQLRNTAGTTFLEISGDGKIKLTSPNSVEVTAPTLQVVGNITATGTIMSGSISLTTHVHPGVTPGGGSTGGPI